MSRPELAPRPPGHDPFRAGVRFTAELVAWVVTPWALWSFSVPLAIVAVLLLIGLPAIFSTPGDRPGGDGPVAVPGIVTILLLVIQLAALSSAGPSPPTANAQRTADLAVGAVPDLA